MKFNSIQFNSNIFYCLCTTESTNNGVGLQVLTTLVTALPLKHIQNVQHGITTSTQIINTTNYIEVVLLIIIIIIIIIINDNKDIY